MSHQHPIKPNLRLRSAELLTYATAERVSLSRSVDLYEPRVEIESSNCIPIGDSYIHIVESMNRTLSRLVLGAKWGAEEFRTRAT